MRALVERCRRGAVRILVCGLAVAGSAPGLARAQSLDALLDVPAWRVDYDVTIAASASSPYTDSADGSGTITTSYDSSFSASMPIDLRSDGPNYVFDTSSIAIPQSGAAPSVQDALAAAEALLAAMEGTANWMSTGVIAAVSPDSAESDASAEEIAAVGLGAMRAAATPARLEYERTVVGRTRDELGNPFSFQERVTATAAGKVLVGSGGLSDVLFQLETRANRYRLVVPLAYRGDVTEAMIEEVSWRRTEHADEPPTEDSQTRRISFDSGYRRITIDEGAPQTLGQSGAVLIVADIEVAGGKLAGERSMAVHIADGSYDDAGMPGTLTLRYTLTPARE